MLTGLKIVVKALVYNGTNQQVETVEISEMDILEYAKEQIKLSYPASEQPKEIFPTIHEVSEEK